MTENNKELLLFQIGPVQDFIAQAETVGDLWAGSAMLSEIAAAALKVIPEYWKHTVFPAVGETDDLAGIPNRFLVYIPDGESGKSLAEKAASAAKSALVEMAQEARNSIREDRRAAFDQQVDRFLSITWAILKNPTGNMANDYKAVGKLMAMRRSTRDFQSWHEEEDGQVKDFLSGKEAALDVRDNRAANRCSGRGAMNLVKKAKAKTHGIPELGDYIAVIAMDGDRMGQKLSSFSTIEQHRDFSRKLADFAKSVSIDSEDGILIYAGGDDVLAAVKAKSAFTVAERLAKEFVSAINTNAEREVTASVGIAVGSAKAPLQDIVREARMAESRAKHVYGRDALAVSVLKRSGEILHWGCKWGSSALKIYHVLEEQDGKLSRFAYKLAGFLAPYQLERHDADWSVMKGVVLADAMHTVEQTDGSRQVFADAMHTEAQTEETKDVAAEYRKAMEFLNKYLDEAELAKRPEDFLGLFLCEAFINRPRD